MGVKIRDGVPRYRKVRGMDRLMRLTGLWAHYGNTLGPGINGRYGAAHRRARRAFRGEAPAATADTLATRGILHVPKAFPRDEALALSAAFDRAIEERPEAVRRPIEGVFGLKRPLDVLGEAPLAVLEGPVRAALEAHYRSHFRVEWLDCYRSTPAAAQATSWLWHMDNVPRGCLKVLPTWQDCHARFAGSQGQVVGVARARNGNRSARAPRSSPPPPAPLVAAASPCRHRADAGDPARPSG